MIFYNNLHYKEIELHKYSLCLLQCTTFKNTGGDRRGDRDRVRKSRNITAVENLIQENTSEKMRIQEDQDQPDSSIEDEEDMGHTDPINSFVNTIRKKGYRDFNDVGSNALTRSIYVFGVVLLCGIAFGYSVALSNTGRIQVLEKEVDPINAFLSHALYY